jgi:membrane-bound lytic murein transglycosylase B
VSAVALILSTLAAFLLSSLPAPVANAETAAQAQQAAARASAEVRALQPQITAAVAAYEKAVSALGNAAGNDISASQRADDADRAVDAATTLQVQRVRALYMNGGQAGLLATVLDAQGPADLLDRLTSVSRVLTADAGGVADARAAAVEAHAAASTDAATANAATVTVEQVQADYQRVQALLGLAQSRLSALSARARTLAAVEAAQRMVTETGLVVTTAGRKAVARATGTGIPPDFLALYKAAALTCPGLDWHVLAAIGQVESHHGRSNGPSPAGAMGPMQFLPSTFQAYAVDGNHDGVADIWNPADAIFTAAHYLCANGAGSPTKLYTAIWHYNHADWYVQMVLAVAASLRVKYP